jgi:hypothetical protein
MHVHLAFAVSSRIRVRPGFILSLCRASIEDATEASLYVGHALKVLPVKDVVLDRDVAVFRDCICDSDENVEMKDNEEVST